MMTLPPTVPELERNLLCPFQLCLNGVTINGNALQFTQKNGEITKPLSIIIPGTSNPINDKRSHRQVLHTQTHMT